MENGTASITIPPLSPGVHNITTVYSGDDKYDLVTEKGNISNNVNLTVDDVVMIYKDYTRETDENGIIKLAITLRPGDYIITTMLEGLEVSNNVKVLPTLITNDLTMNYKDGSKFNATLLDGQGNPLTNQTLRFNVNGVFYNKVSDENGLASLAINLNKGAYIITSYLKDYEITIF